MAERKFLAQMYRRCCDWTVKSEGPGSTRAAHWQLYVYVPGLQEWPKHRWTGRHRLHVIPTPEERDEALARLGFRRVDDADWEWIESTAADWHGHPAQVLLIASVDVEPIAEGGDTR